MKRNTLGILVLCVLLIIVGIVFNKMYSTDHTSEISTSPPATTQSKPVSSSSVDIDQLTRQDVVVSYLRKNDRLPDYYVTKQQARAQGWNSREGNLCSILPGRAIGGDRFSNREKALPTASGRIWFEADINYHCGHRGAERLLYSNDGLIYVTHNHYKNFTEVIR